MKSALGMTNPSELLEQAAWDRDLAKRAAGFAEWLLWDAVAATTRIAMKRPRRRRESIVDGSAAMSSIQSYSNEPG